jgi:hypothetical protein
VRGGLAATLSKYAEAFELIWFQYVVGYDKQEQRSLATSLNNQLFGYKRSLGNVMDDLRRERQPWLWKWIYLVGVLPLVPFGWFLFLRLRRWGLRRGLPWSRLKESEARSAVVFYERLSKLLMQRGMTRSPHETPLEFAGNMKRHEVSAITAAYNRVRFGGQELTATEAEQISGWLRQLEQEHSE